MKKFLIYSGIITISTMFVGMMFVYGTFDFRSGQSQLIGPSKTISKIEDHNKIIKQVHKIGLAALDAKTEFGNLLKSNDLKDFNNAIEQVKNAKNRVSIEDETYMTAIQDWLNILYESAAYLNSEEITEESLALFEDKIKNRHEALVQAHNQYVEKLNSRN